MPEINRLSRITSSTRQVILDDKTPHGVRRKTRLFVSHCVQDSKCAEIIIEYLINSLPSLKKSQIRCTSLPEYGLTSGAAHQTALREEVITSEAFIAILSENSMMSTYSLFEMGARWGSHNDILTVLAPGAKPNILDGPLHDFNAVEIEDAVVLREFANTVSERMNIKLIYSHTLLELATTYSSKLRKLLPD